MLSIDLFNSRYEKKLHEGAVDDAIAHLIEPLSRRAMDIRTQLRSRRLDPKQVVQLEKEYEELVQKRLDIILDRKTQTEQQVPSKQDPFAYVKPEPKGIGDVQDPQQKMAQLAQQTKKGPLANVGAGLKAFIKGEPEPMDEEQQAINPRALGVANFQRLVKANMGNIPTVSLEFIRPEENFKLDQKGLDLISDYYDGLESDQAKNYFIYRVLPSGDETTKVLKQLGWSPQIQQSLPGIPTQGELPLQEKKKSNNDDLEAGDVKVARELQKLRARYPAVRSDIEAVASAEIDSTERSQQQLAAIRGANEKQDALLKQLVDLDKEQGREIDGLDQENNSLEKRLAQVQATNDRLQQAIGQMTGTKKAAAKTKTTAPQGSADIARGGIIDVGAPATPTSNTTTVTPTSNTTSATNNKAMKYTSQQIQGLGQAAPNIRGKDPANDGGQQVKKVSGSDVNIEEHGGGIGPRQHWQDLMQEGQPQELINRYLAIDAENDVDAVRAAIQAISKDPALGANSKSRLLGQIGMIIRRHRLPIGRSYYQFMQQYMEDINETSLNPKDPQGDYETKRRALHDLSLNKGVDQAAVLQRRLDLDREAKAKGLAETVTNVKAGMAEIYRSLAPKIERHRDSFLAGQLYDELENYAELHGAEREFKQMMNGARNRAHMEYDTNPGGFHNWFWFLPFEDNMEEGIKSQLAGAALAGTLALGAGSANARVTGDEDPGVNRLTGKPNVTQAVQGDQVKPSAPTGFSKEYLQSVVDGTHPRPMITKEKAQALLNQLKEQGVAEGTDDIKKRMSKLEALALAANRAGDDAKCKMYQQKIQSLKQKLSQSMNEFDASGYDRYSIYMDDYDLKEKFSDLDDAVDAIEAYKRDDPKSRYADYNVRDLDGKVVWRNDAWQDIQKPGKIQFLPRNDQGVAEATGDDRFDSMMNRIGNDPWTQLNSDPNWEYEIEELVDQQIEPWLLAMERSGMPITRDGKTLNPGWRKRYEQVSTQLAQKYLASKKFNPRDPDLVGKIRAAIDNHTDQSRNVAGQLSAYADDLPMHRYADAFDADGQTANIRDAMAGLAPSDDDDDDGYAPRPRPTANPRRLDPGNMEEAKWDPFTGGDFSATHDMNYLPSDDADADPSKTTAEQFKAMIQYYSNNALVRQALDDLYRVTVGGGYDDSVVRPEKYLATIENQRTGKTEKRYFKSKEDAYRYAKGNNAVITNLDKINSREDTSDLITLPVLLGLRDHKKKWMLKFPSEDYAQKWEFKHKNAAQIQWPAGHALAENAVDSKSWMAQTRTKYPAAKFMQAKTPGAPIRAYVNGKVVAEFNFSDSKGIAESAKPGEYYVHTVYFKDGTKKRVRVTSDEVDVADYYTKRGKAVDRVDYDFQLHSDMTEQFAMPGTTIPRKSVIQGYTVFFNPKTRLVSITRGGDSEEAAIEQARIGTPSLKNFRLAADRLITKIESDLNEGREIQTREDFIRERDRLLRMIGIETDPANKQILKSAIRQLENRAENEGWITIQSRMVREDSDNGEAVEMAIMRRMLVAHTDLIIEFGLDKVVNAIEEVAYNVGDTDEIGSSDVSGWVRQVKQILGVDA